MSRFSIRDNNLYDLKSTLSVLEHELFGTEKAVLVKCPMCNNITLAIRPKRRLQTSKCSYCSSTMKVLILADGVYRIKTPTGVLEVAGNKRTWIQSIFK